MKKKKNQSEANIKPVTSISSEQGVEVSQLQVHLEQILWMGTLMSQSCIML